MKVKLSKSNAMFFDPETGFRLSGDEVRDLDKIGYLTRQWMVGGGIVILKEDTDVSGVAKPTTQAENPEILKDGGATTSDPIFSHESNVLVEPNIEDAVSEMLTKYTNTEIRNMAKERGIKFKMNLGIKKLAKQVIEFDRAKIA
jgi:hypothetical protein